MRKKIIKCKLLRRIKVPVSVVILTLSMGTLSACSQAPGSATIIAGSTSVQPYAEILAEEYMTLNPDTVIDIQGGGSSAGITATKTHSANIGMSSRALKDDEESLWNVEIAKDGLVLIVNPANPIQNLTSEQIRDIYSAATTHWSELGGSKSKINIISREEGSGTRSAFTEMVMGDKEITPKAIVQDSNGAVLQLVADDPNAIGFISLGLITDQVKALHLDGVEATRENIMNSSYTLFRQFLFVTNGEPSGLDKKFIDFSLSSEGQKLLINEGLIPSAEGVGE
ncbi:phosphate ABC transporter substrate-binding protein (PhoT family) [Anaerobacterium chartisolvens]|uniref:Phosphate-binding protein n=1 Tax=Anaerobacterium chartisolvens TaxID=1297424 RepID=A0A369BJX0_9FIRM|nr:phosphate ABC transporter substrate-binding protein [Anaerobacterium chartisolvens]RCX19994.1 phosphate ABC transporter substrate-binding protein (PhoT family) [Anaerobacterium chartisolvens]